MCLHYFLLLPLSPPIILYKSPNVLPLILLLYIFKIKEYMYIYFAEFFGVSHMDI